MKTFTAPLSAFLMTIFLSGGVSAANYDPATSDPIVEAPSGIWQEVLPDGRSVPVFGPRDPGPCSYGSNTRPCLDNDWPDHYNKPKKGDSIVRWILLPVDPPRHRFPGNGGGLVDNPACEKAHNRPPFCDQHVVHPPVVEPPMAPIPVTGALWHLLSALIFGAVFMRFFPQSLIDRPDRA